MKKKLLIAGLVAAIVAVVAVPALAQTSTKAPVEATERVRPDRSFPPAWIDASLDDLKAQVAERSERFEARISASDRLSEDQKAEILADVDSMLAAVDAADANAEVIGTVVSRTQIERRTFRAERRGETFNIEANIAGDVERAERRLERLTKVTGWAGAAGEDVDAIQGYLAEAAAQLDVATGDGDVIARHDAAHIALAWLTEAAAALDSL